MYSYTDYIGDGHTDVFAIPFPYLNQSHIKVYIDGVLYASGDEKTKVLWTTTSSIKLSKIPAAQSTVRIKRETPKLRMVDYKNSATFNEADMDKDSDQAFYVVQELSDITNQEYVNELIENVSAAVTSAEQSATSAANSATLAEAAAVNAQQEAIAAVTAAENVNIQLNNFTVGDGTDGDKTFVFDLGLGDANPKLKYDSINNKWQYSNDGTTFVDIGGSTGTIDADTLEGHPASEFLLHSQAVDYVVEQGSNANGNWRKWNSGVMECWGRKTVSASITNTTSAGFYASEILTIIYPVVFYSIDESSISTVYGDNAATMIYYVNATVSQQSFYLVHSKSISTSNYDVGYHATGRWKA